MWWIYCLLLFEKLKEKLPTWRFRKPTTKNKRRIIIPLYNGFGNEEDSLGNCLRIVNQQSKKDYYKYIDNGKWILRFLSKIKHKRIRGCW